jgi:ADP-Ribosyltransferase in polyvalent proteins
MEWYRVVKVINGRKYIYEQKTYREGKHVRTLNRYIGPANNIVYHATREVFDRFDVSKAGSNTGWANASFGIFFSDNKDAVLEFAENTRGVADDRPVFLKAARVNIRNPLDLTTEGLFNKAKQAPLIVKLLGGEDLSPEDALAYLNETIDLGTLPEVYEGIYSSLDNKKLMQEHGYDGIVSQFGRDEKGDTIKEYVAFENSQIEAIE